jgi:two-component system, OmpR family, response regulator
VKSCLKSVPLHTSQSTCKWQKGVHFSMSHILIVDDDPHFRELVSVTLKREGFHTYEAADGMEALAQLESRKTDLVIIDVLMPNMDGWQLCRAIRKQYDLPLLMLTAKGETREKVKGFRLGTDDYLVKPFESEELIVRIRALLRRYRINASQKVEIGHFVLNRNTYEVTTGRQKVMLPLKEFELLFKLASFPEKTFSRDQLIEDIWGFDFDGNERTLDVHINRLRKRFPDNEYPFKIRTIRGLGYRLEVSP